MTDSTRFTGQYARWSSGTCRRLALGAGVLDLLSVLLRDPGHWLLTKRVVLILPHSHDAPYADLYTLSAAVTFLGVYADEELT